MYSHAFSIYNHFAIQYDVTQCIQLLVKHLQSDTLKVRDQAFDAIISYFIAVGLDRNKLQTITAFDFMLAKPS